MKKSWKKIKNFVTDALTITTAIISVSAYILGYLHLFSHEVCVPYWAMIVGFVSPYIIYKITEALVKKRRRKFKTGDVVSILGDKRDFMVFEYETWRPDYVKIKRINGDMVLLVHQKFLTKAQVYDSMEKTIDNITGKSRIQPPLTSVIHEI